MYPRTHFVVGLIFSIIILFSIKEISLFNFLVVVIFFLSSILIDSDHYIYYVVKKKDTSLEKAYRWFIERTGKIDSIPFEKQKEYKKIFLVFHGIEFWIFLYILSNSFYIFAPILFGFLFHMIFDWIDILDKGNGWGVFFSRVSWIYLLLGNKNKKEFKF